MSVIIAAYNAEATIGRAIRSALAQPETAEVVVVDDRSSDTTRDVVAELSAHDTRLRMIALDANGGPAQARNRGLDEACAAYVAILDADDFFLPGRLSRLAALLDGDFVADNIAFVLEARADALEPSLFAGDAEDVTVTVASFAQGNLAGPRSRGELGFLKPVMARDFLNRHALRYDEALRLGEDYDLYMRALLAGARFRLTRSVGYCAVVRDGSLSARHATADLDSFHAAVTRHAGAVAAGSSEHAAITAYARQVRHRRDHRRFLDHKAQTGLGSALRFAFSEPRRAGPIALGVLRDKLHLRPTAVIPEGAGFRTLLEV